MDETWSNSMIQQHLSGKEQAKHDCRVVVVVVVVVVVIVMSGTPEYER